MAFASGLTIFPCTKQMFQIILTDVGGFVMEWVAILTVVIFFTGLGIVVRDVIKEANKD